MLTPRSSSPLKRRDELGKVLFGNAPRFADLDAAQLTRPEQVVDLVAADMEHLGDFLNGEGLHSLITSRPPLNFP